MLVSFSVGNYLSFKDIQMLSLTADALKELPDNLHTPFLYDGEERLLKSVALYGHNSHGKTNLVKAFRFFQRLVFTSFTRGQTTDNIELEPFRLDTTMAGKPSYFELCFLIKETKYRYEVLATNTQILQEGLYYSQAKIRENHLFQRDAQSFRVSRQWNRDNDQKVESMLPFAKPTVLLLSVLLSQENFTVIGDVGHWLRNNLVVPDNYLLELQHARAIYSDPEYTGLILKFIESADLGFKTIFDKLAAIKSSRPALQQGFLNMAFEREIKDFELFTRHSVYDQARKEVGKIEFELMKDESAGSIKYFIIVCLLAYAIRHSQLIWIDELDSRFHALLLEMLVSSFHNPIINPINSQLIFTTHNTHLLDQKLRQLRRDQMVVVEKNEWGESSIARAHTVENPVRIGKSLEKEYKKGNLGGISKKIKRDLGPTLFDNL